MKGILTALLSLRYSDTSYINTGRNIILSDLARLPSTNNASRLFGIKNQIIPINAPSTGLFILMPIHSQLTAPSIHISPTNMRYPISISPPASISQNAITYAQSGAQYLISSTPLYHI